ncbi:hypothetical protein PR202_ga08895 [Eleusine coracana subsp. coracana]|uniref:Glutamine amidotransferase type-2 domain-containing protein n=1 Tax=Eleusine coracana subsp. coracana TaxID=191504 RepID=A0AAV5C1Q4_ELECO|nr:hypothetical protein PR202_ga08895 [Eleusine coracana subsp. coracana]
MMMAKLVDTSHLVWPPPPPPRPPPPPPRLLRHSAPAPGTTRLRFSTRIDLRHRSAARLSPAPALLPDRVTPFNFDADGDDHPREECGVFGVIGDPDASSLCYLGLQKLQHRGEEGAGIAAAGVDGKLKSVTGLGLVGDVFRDPARLANLPGNAAIGHVRYSTAGAAAALRNVQPFLAAYRFGQVAVAHNGNLVNYQALRNRLEAQGSIFNTSSDTEVILHLIATSLSLALAPAAAALPHLRRLRAPRRCVFLALPHGG